MRILLPTALLLTSLSAPLAEAQVKRGGGLFGFNKNADQISAGLFPTDTPAPMPVSTSSETAAPSSTTPSAPAQTSSSSGNPIFRTGSPQQVGEVSYTLDSTDTAVQKVEKAKKRGSFFSFGKKSDPEPSQPVIAPIPQTIAPPAPVQQTTQRIENTVTETIRSTENTADEAMETALAATEAPAVPNFAQPAKEEKSRFMSFFSRKKKDTADVISNAQPQMPNVVSSGEGSYEITNPNQSNLPGSTQPERDGGLLPASKKRGEKKSAPLDMTGAETIIQNGEIVAPDDNGFTSNVAPQGNGVKAPPKVINGVKTYSSWEDVEAAPVSAADKILRQIR